MRTIWFNLAWKEWHEHKWKLAALIATMWSVTALILRERGVWVIDAVRVTLVMCIGAAVLSIRKVMSIDPVGVFR